MHNPWVSHASGDTPTVGATGVRPDSLTLRWRVFNIPAGRGVSACEQLFARAANTAFSELRLDSVGEPVDAVFLDSGSAFAGDRARSFLAFSSGTVASGAVASGAASSEAVSADAASAGAESTSTASSGTVSFQDAASPQPGPGFAAPYALPEQLGAGGGADFFGALRRHLQRVSVPPEFPRELTGGFALGWVGAFGYELKNLPPDVRASDTARGSGALRHPSHPDAALLFADRGLVFSPHDGVVLALALEPALEAGTAVGARPRVAEDADPAEVAGAPSGADEGVAAAVNVGASEGSADRWFAELEERFGPGLARLFDAAPQGADAAEQGSVAERGSDTKQGSAAAQDKQTTAQTRAAQPTAEYRLDHGHEHYLANVRACQEHIAAGDSYELCLTTTARGPALAEPWLAYQQLRTTSPVPYGAYLQFPGMGAADTDSPGRGPRGLHVLSASPERFLRIQRAETGVAGASASEDGTDPGSGVSSSALVVEAKPIKGTRPRGTGAEDARWRRELQNSEKDRAENLMIVDLLRNDLAKICRPGTVRVPKLFDVESYSHVHQLVSTITGELAAGAGAGVQADAAEPGAKGATSTDVAGDVAAGADARPGADAVDCLAACFPGGSMTGAPKVRSMELLEEIEGHARGLYSGAIGWLSPTGEADLSITIRTLIDDGRESSFGVGGAIVTDSDPEAEWQEILVKASALLDALGARIVEDDS